MRVCAYICACALPTLFVGVRICVCTYTCTTHTNVFTHVHISPHALGRGIEGGQRTRSIGREHIL